MILWKKESDVQPYIPDMVEKMKKDGFAYESEGALVVDVTEEGDKKELPPYRSSEIQRGYFVCYHGSGYHRRAYEIVPAGSDQFIWQTKDSLFTLHRYSVWQRKPVS